jgi:hypothetical protein
MQNTRLNNLVNGALARFGRWFANPWRHLSLVLMSLLLGTFLGSAIPSTAGQAAKLDLVGAGVLILLPKRLVGLCMVKVCNGGYRLKILLGVLC